MKLLRFFFWSLNALFCGMSSVETAFFLWARNADGIDEKKANLSKKLAPPEKRAMEVRKVFPIHFRVAAGHFAPFSEPRTVKRGRIARVSLETKKTVQKVYFDQKLFSLSHS